MAIDRIVVDARKPTEARAKEGWGESPADVISIVDARVIGRSCPINPRLRAWFRNNHEQKNSVSPGTKAKAVPDALARQGLSAASLRCAGSPRRRRARRGGRNRYGRGRVPGR